ncbi:MAG: hypothetical protein IPJ05_02645 [Nitrosomonas sp.]|nr:hypothetical protein [Nitrosomonas sp.]
MKFWYTPKELAGLPGMPETVSGVIRSAKKNLIKLRKKPRSKGLEYHLLSLPTITQRYIAQHQDLFGGCAEFIQGVTPSPRIAAASPAVGELSGATQPCRSFLTGQHDSPDLAGTAVITPAAATGSFLETKTGMLMTTARHILKRVLQKQRGA